MRDVEIIDRELRNLASLRWVLRECHGTASSLDGVGLHVDELLDERIRTAQLSDDR